MNILSISSYLLLLAIGIFSIFLVWKMVQKFHLKYLFYYFLFLTLSHAFNFLDIIGSYFTLGILNFHKSSKLIFSTVSLAFSLLAIPFLIMAWYFFIHMILELRQKNFPLKYKIEFFIFQSIMVILFTVTIHNYITSTETHFIRLSDQILFVFFAINHIILIMMLLQIFLFPLPSDEPDMKKGIKRFSAIYLIIIPFHFIFLFIPLPETLKCYGHPIVEFFMHLPPLFYLWYFLNQYYKDHPIHSVNESDILQLFSKYKISEREQEIIQLILKGKSNQIISDELFISLKTVKAHLYNIYKKFNINSRWQLINVVQNFQSNQSLQ